MTIKPIRKVIGSLTGEVWETRSAKVPRRKLPDGRTETGRDVPAGHPEFESSVDEGEEIEILIEVPEESDDEGLDWKPASMSMDAEYIPDIPEAIPDPIEPEPLTGKQVPKSTAKDIDKIQDLRLAIGCIFDGQPYSGEDKAIIISRLFADTTDLRVETSQVVISGRMYGIFAAVVSVALLLKGSSGLSQNFGNIFNWPVAPQAKEPDVFGEEDGPD